MSERLRQGIGCPRNWRHARQRYQLFGFSIGGGNPSLVWKPLSGFESPEEREEKIEQHVKEFKNWTNSSPQRIK